MIFDDSKIFCDAVLDTILLSSSSKPMIVLLNILMPVIVDRSMSWNNGLMLEAFIFFVVVVFFNCKCKHLVPSLQFSFSNLFKSPSLRSWILGLLLSVLALINCLLFSLLKTGTLRAHYCYFLLLRIIDEYYKARGAFNLFQWNEWI